MFVYFFTFIVTILISSTIEKTSNKKNMILLSFFLLVFLSFISGVRSINLGFDAKVYINNVFNNISRSTSFSNFMELSSLESGFSILSYILFKINPNINFMLFGYSFITTLFIMLFALREKEKISFTNVMAVYYLTIYLHSFNLIRQCISISIILYAFSLFKDKKYKSSIFWIIVSLFIHDSAIFSLPLFILYAILNEKKKNSTKIVYGLFIILLLICIAAFYEKIILFFYNINLISYKYASYISKFETPDFNVSTIFVKVIWMILIFISLKNRKILKSSYVYILFLVLDFIVTILSIKINPLQRITYYYYYVGLFYFLPNLRSAIKKDKFNKMFINMIIYGNLIIFVLWKTVIGNGYAIYPYRSDIISWLNLFF